jgi:hypothetical protein
MRKLLTGIILALILASVALPALGHRGTVTGYADCLSWHVSAKVYNINPNRLVVVTSGIPGTPYLESTGFSAGDAGLEVWSQTGASPVEGTVILTIYSPDGIQIESMSSLTIKSPNGCDPDEIMEPTPSPEPSIPDTSMSAQ